MKSNTTLAFLNFIALLGVIVMNGLANGLPINGKTTGELSDFYPNLFVPAGVTFSIWGIIYLSLLIFCGYSIYYAFKNKAATDTFLTTIGPFFMLNALANMSWIIAWHYQQIVLSLVIMLGILGTLLTIYQRLSIGESNATTKEKLLVHLPFSIYLGWITIATIANVTTLLVDNNWTGGGIGEPTWAILVIVVGIIIGILMLFRKKDLIFNLVIMWALYGIYLKRSAANLDGEQGIITITLVGIGLIGILGVVQLFRRKLYYF